MKAYQLMTFLLIFNMSISIVAGLGIYNMGLAVDEKYDVTQYEADPTNPESLSFRVLAINLIGLTGGVVAGALIGAYLLKIPADSGAAYGAFTGVFWSATLSTMAILWNVAGGHIGIVVIIVMFFILSGVVFFAGLMQLVRGPWRGMA